MNEGTPSPPKSSRYRIHLTLYAVLCGAVTGGPVTVPDKKDCLTFSRSKWEIFIHHLQLSMDSDRPHLRTGGQADACLQSEMCLCGVVLPRPLKNLSRQKFLSGKTLSGFSQASLRPHPCQKSKRCSFGSNVWIGMCLGL